jgi:hypothetical protein
MIISVRHESRHKSGATDASEFTEDDSVEAAPRPAPSCAEAARPHDGAAAFADTGDGVACSSPSVFADCSHRWDLVSQSRARARGNGVPCAAFLDACAALAAVFALEWSPALPAMHPVHDDLRRNIGTLRANYEEFLLRGAGGGAGGTTLEELCQSELAADGAPQVRTLVQDQGSTLCAVLWLKRALAFVAAMLRRLLESEGWTLREAIVAACVERTRSRFTSYPGRGVQ